MAAGRTPGPFGILVVRRPGPVRGRRPQVRGAARLARARRELPVIAADFRCARPHQHLHDRIPPSRCPDRDHPRVARPIGGEDEDLTGTGS